ncbi:MarR family winged helix-turn-helix transcriptional regulator [Candidatus Neomarinimicrobiota bacterium]
MNVKSNNVNQMVLDLLRIGTFLLREGNRTTGEYDLTQQQFVVLKEIMEKGPISAKRIVGELLFEKSNVSKIIRKLKTNALIEVVVSADDARMKILTITSRGRDVCKAIIEKFESWNQNWTAPLADHEIEQSDIVLQRICELIRGE